MRDVMGCAASHARIGERRTEVAWTDPVDALGRIGQTSGLDYLLAVMSGALPQMPILSAWGVDRVAEEPDRVELRAQPTEMLYDQIGTVHGGFTSTLLDTACGLAGFSTQPAGQLSTSMDLSVRFLRPVLVGDAVRTVGEVVKPGRTVIATEARLLDARGRILATATSGLLALGVDR